MVHRTLPGDTAVPMERNHAAPPTVTAATYTDGVPAGTAHSWTVAAVSATAESAQSAAVSAQSNAETVQGIVLDAMNYGDGAIAVAGGYGWAAPAAFPVAEYLFALDAMDYGDGAIATITGGTGWAGAANFPTTS